MNTLQFARNRKTTRSNLSNRSVDTIVRISCHDLRPGYLGDLFRGGAKAVVLADDPRVTDMWRKLVDDPEQADPEMPREVLPWNLTLMDMARNHRTDIVMGSHLGDLVQPSSLCFIGRKMLIYREPSDQTLATIPDQFAAGDRVFQLDRNIVSTAWELGSEILESLLSGQGGLPGNGVTLDRLRYDSRLEDLERRCDLFENAQGAWAKIGARIDAYKHDASGMMEAKFIRDIYGVSRLLPGLGALTQALSARTGRRHRPHYPRSNAYVIGGAHADSQFFHALASQRTDIKTEIFDGGAWRECRLAPNTLTIWPGKSVPRSTGINPTIHRILHVQPDDAPRSESMNISLILGAMPIGKGVSAKERWTRPA